MSVTSLACLTPPGVAALATLVLHGPRAWPILRELFRPVGSASLPDEPQPARFWFGRLGEAGTVDDVVLAVKRTAPDSLCEIHCHGGREVVALLQDLFVARGVDVCDWQEFRRRAGVPSWRVEVEAALTHASTVRTAAILLDQYHGACEIALARIQAYLQAGARPEAARLVEELERWIPLGRHLVEPWHVVIAGAPNVGKSSLVNALAGFARSIVSPEPGTTRDVVTTRLSLDGWPVEIADTAGWRKGQGDVETAGIERGQVAAETADLVLWLLDASQAPVFPDNPPPRILYVINKIDLRPAWDFSEVPEAAQVSARTGDRVTDICHRIALRLVPEAPPAAAAVPFTSEHRTRLNKAKRCLSAG